LTKPRSADERQQQNPAKPLAIWTIRREDNRVRQIDTPKGWDTQNIK